MSQSAGASVALPPLQGAALVLSALAISVVAFAEVLDMTIVNVAVPSIAGELGATTSEGTWAISSYAMAAAASQPLTGWMTKRFGPIRIFIVPTLLFTLTSALCGMACSMHSLVAQRLLQGLVRAPCCRYRKR